MAEQKGIGSKILGIFVETGEPKADDADSLTDSGKSAAEMVAELAQSSAPRAAPPGPAAPGLPPSNLRLDKMAAPAAGGPTDFDAIFRDAGMDAAELDRVKKAEELLKTLPESTPEPVKRQIVEASLKAFGFELDKITLAAHNQTRALDAFVKVHESATAKAITDAQAEIQALNEKITALRGDIDKRTSQLSSLSAQAQTRKAQVQKVIDFFQPPGSVPTPGKA
jgi:hypothetical protein